jgi:hypothetical protein
MKEKSLPPGIEGFTQKLLAFDRLEGDQSKVARTAFALSQKRANLGLPGCPEGDWKKAEEIVRLRFAREVMRRLA